MERGLQDASKWRDAICGEPYDLEFLSEISTKMDVRQELWKYVEVSMHAIKDCKGMLFKKVHVSYIIMVVIINLFTDLYKKVYTIRCCTIIRGGILQ